MRSSGGSWPFFFSLLPGVDSTAVSQGKKLKQLCLVGDGTACWEKRTIAVPRRLQQFACVSLRGKINNTEYRSSAYPWAHRLNGKITTEA